MKLSPTSPKIGFKRLAVLICLVASTGMTQGQERVRIKGQVIVSDQVRTDVDLTVDVGDTSCVQVLLFGRGRFEIDALQDERYELRFEQAGSVSKSVLVDTRNVELKLGEKKRTVEFDVVMAPLDTVAPLVYSRPVGKINFHQSNGRMVVERDRTMTTPREVVWKR